MDKSDIKLVLKGGLNLRLLTKAVINCFESNINIENKDADMQKFKLIIKELDKESANINNPFSSIASKSDIDFVLSIDKVKFSKEQYEKIKEKLVIFTLDYLFKLKNHLKNTQFFGNEHKYEKLDYDKTFINSLNKFPHKSNVICDSEEINMPDNTLADKRVVFYPIDSYFKNKINDEHFDNYYVSYNKNFNMKLIEDDFEESAKNLDILRLKNNYIVSLTEKPDQPINIPGELIDIAILDYETSENITEEDLFKVNYKNNIVNFDLTVFNLSYLIKDLEHMIYVDFMYPWINPKYKKRINRLIFLVILDKIIEISKSPVDSKIKIAEIKAHLSIDINTILKQNPIPTIDRDNLLFNLVEKSKFLKSKIDMVTTDRPKYEEYLTKYNYDVTTIDYTEHLRVLQEEYDNYVKYLVEAISKGIELLDLLGKYINEQIKTEINKVFVAKSLPVMQWGGYRKFYKTIKNHYLELKGGAITFLVNFATGKFQFQGIANSHLYTNSQMTYINYFFNTILKDNVEIDGAKFTQLDITNATVLGCGSFGCGIVVNHSPSNKKYLFKILGSNSTGISNYDRDFNDYLKETLFGYYITQKNIPNFNKTFAFFRTSSIPTDAYFSSLKANFTLLNPAVNNNSNVNIRNKKIFILVTEAGTNSLTKLPAHINNYFLPATIITPNIINNVIKTYAKLFKQMITSLVHLTNCNKLNNCQYVSHMDIKPDNIIFKKNNNVNDINDINYYDYDLEYIDYGGIRMSNNFFTDPYVLTHLFRNYVYFFNNAIHAKVTASPLYDLATAIYSIFYMLKNTNNILSTHINTLKVYYSRNDIPNINLTYNTIRTNLITEEIKITIFKNNPSILVIDPKLAILANVMIYYLNVAICINKFFMDNRDVFDIRKDINDIVNNIEFKNYVNILL